MSTLNTPFDPNWLVDLTTSVPLEVYIPDNDFRDKVIRRKSTVDNAKRLREEYGIVIFNSQMHDHFSNFYLLDNPLADISGNGLYYTSVEHAYQASKTSDYDIRRSMSTHGNIKDKPAHAKMIGGKVQRWCNDEEWKTVQFEIMFQYLLQKYLNNPMLRDFLISTNPYKLIHLVHWKDSTWGLSTSLGYGCDALGVLTTIVRKIIQ